MNSLVVKSLICILVCLGLGIGSGLSTSLTDMSWYDNLKKPFFNPPSWIFGPAWTLLYTMMGLAIARVWQIDSSISGRSTAIKLFVMQFILNLIWTPIFFSLQRMDISMVIIICLWCLIFLTIRHFSKLDKTAGYLMVPYLMWVSFATVLNASLLYLN